MSIFTDDDKGDKNREDLLNYLLAEIEQAEAEHSENHGKYERWRRHREVIPEQKERNWPWTKSSNVVPPVVAIAAHSAYGNVDATFGMRSPHFMAKSVSEDPDKVEEAAVLTEYLSILSESSTDLDLKVKRRTIEYETTTMGMCPVKIPWTTRRWHFKDVDESGNETNIETNLHNGPELIPIKLENILYREGYEDINDMPWFGHRFQIPKHVLINESQDGVYENVDNILDFIEKNPTEDQYDSANRESSNIFNIAAIDLYEIYVYWDVDGDGYMEDVIITLDKKTQSILKEDFNKLGFRPFIIPVYLHNPFSITGRGVCQLADSMQEESIMLHNSRNNNSLISGMRMFAARRGCGLKTNEMLYPGRILFVDSPKEDLVPIQAGEVYPSSLQAEGLCTSYIQKVTGMSDTMAGFADQTLKSRDTIGGQMLRLQQGKGIFNSVVGNLEDAYSKMGMLILFQLIEHKVDVIAHENFIKRLDPKKIEILDRVLSIPKNQVPLRLSISVKTTDVEETKDAKRQNLLTMIQIMNMYYKGVTEMAMQLYNPQMMQIPTFEPVRNILTRGIIASTKMFEESLKFFDIDNYNEYVPDYQMNKVIADMKQFINNMNAEKLEEEFRNARNEQRAMVSAPEGEGRPEEVMGRNNSNQGMGAY